MGANSPYFKPKIG